MSFKQLLATNQTHPVHQSTLPCTAYGSVENLIPTIDGHLHTHCIYGLNPSRFLQGHTRLSGILRDARTNGLRVIYSTGYVADTNASKLHLKCLGANTLDPRPIRPVRA